MAKKIIRQGVDETLLMNIVGGGAPLPPPESNPVHQPLPKNPLAVTIPQTSDTRRRKTGIPEFEPTFVRVLNIRPNERLYVRPEIKRTLVEIVRRIGTERMNIQSYVELILLNHIDIYRDEINRLIEARAKQNLL